MAGTHRGAPPITSVAELLAVGSALEDRAAARYRQFAAATTAAGNPEAAAVLEALAAERQRRGADLRAGPDRGRAAPTAAMAGPDGLADEDPFTVTSYRILGAVVRDEARAFAFYAHIAAHAPDQEVRRLAERLAHEKLGHAAAVRRRRRDAWRRALASAGQRLPLPQNLGELQALATSMESAMAARHAGLAEAAAALGDLESAEVLRGVVTDTVGQIPSERPSTLATGEPVPVTANAFDLLRAALIDLDRAYDTYLRAAEGRAVGEDLMLEAQRRARGAMERSGVIRARLVMLGRMAKP